MTNRALFVVQLSSTIKQVAGLGLVQSTALARMLRHRRTARSAATLTHQSPPCAHAAPPGRPAERNEVSSDHDGTSLFQLLHNHEWSSPRTGPAAANLTPPPTTTNADGTTTSLSIPRLVFALDCQHSRRLVKCGNPSRL